MSSIERKCKNLLLLGLSYNKISSILNISKSTVNYWYSTLNTEEKSTICDLRKAKWKESISQYLRKKKEDTLKEEESSQIFNSKIIGKLSKRELLLVGSALYWAEGSKTNRWQIQFSNSDPEMIKIIMKYFRDILKIKEQKFYMQMILHKNVNEKIALGYWSRITHVPQTQFKKACFSLSKASLMVRKRKTLPYGTLQVRVLDKTITQKVYGYILGLKKN